MPFIGNQPALSYTSFAKQDFTTSATTSYTLDNPVTNENEIALFINFVRQEPTTAYTASGTSLTLTSATSASDDMYCVFLGKAIQTVNPPNGSVGLSQLSATGTKDSTTFLRGDNTFATAGGDNTPAFSATVSSTQSLSNATETLVQYNTELYDTNSAYDTSTYKFTVPTGKGGKYFITASLKSYNATVNNSILEHKIILKKNGTEIAKSDMRNAQGTSSGSTLHSPYISVNGIFSLNAGDYIQCYTLVWVNSSTPSLTGNALDHNFSGFKLVE